MKANKQLRVGDRFVLSGGKAIPADSVKASASPAATVRSAKEMLGQRFNIVAYSGKPIAQWWSDTPLVIDIAASTVSKVFPILQHHSTFRMIGHATEAQNDGNKALSLDCVVSVPSEASLEFVEGARAGFPWRASIGSSVLKRTEYKAGQPVEVNGRKLSGPIVIIAANLYETSVLPLPADDETRVTLV